MITTRVDEFMIGGVAQEREGRRNPYLIKSPTNRMRRAEAAPDACRSEYEFFWEPELVSLGFWKTTFLVHLLIGGRGLALLPDEEEAWPIFTFPSGYFVAAVRADDRRVWLIFIVHSHAAVCAWRCGHFGVLSA